MSLGRTATLNTGHKMPTLGYGTWQSKPGEVGDGVFEALKAGYRHLDLAVIYGNQPEVAQGIKRAIAEVPGLKREDIFITSKLWNNSHRPQDVAAALDQSLAQLELEYLDVRFTWLLGRGMNEETVADLCPSTAHSFTSSTGPSLSSPAAPCRPSTRVPSRPSLTRRFPCQIRGRVCMHSPRQPSRTESHR